MSKNSNVTPNSNDIVERLATGQDADFYIFSGDIERDTVNKFIDHCNCEKAKKNVSLIICTYGGDGDAAYIIAKYLKNKYEKFRLYVFGFCKSAGTLIALGADEIIMSYTGELGPLDVQILKDDVLSPRGSGLDIINAISSLRQYSFDYFETHLLELKKRSGYTISTRIASDIACKLAIGLISPIMSQIDPVKIGEIQRSLSIAYEYGKRLNPDEDIVNSLTYNYPSHTFVIDYEEAKKLLPNVRLANANEIELERHLTKIFLDSYKWNIIHQPGSDLIIKKININDTEQNNGTKASAVENEGNSLTSDQNGEAK